MTSLQYLFEIKIVFAKDIVSFFYWSIIDMRSYIVYKYTTQWFNS